MKQDKPSVSSEQYQQIISDFYISIAAAESDEVLFGLEKMQDLADQYPEEPAIWANLGVFAMRQGNFELATDHMKKALEKTDSHSAVLFLKGLLESRKGNIEESVNYLRKAAHIDASDNRKWFALAEELERQNAEANFEEIDKLFNLILEQHPQNLAIQFEMVRLASKWGSQRELKESLQHLEQYSQAWPEAVKVQFMEQKQAILKKQGGNISYELAFLRNTLSQLPLYHSHLEQINLPEQQVGFFITEFIWLPNKKEEAFPPDMQLEFLPLEKLQPKEGGRFIKAIGEAEADGQLSATIHVQGNNAITSRGDTLVFPGKNNGDPMLSTEAITRFDYNFDFLSDLFLAGNKGVKIYRQTKDSSYTDVTADVNLSQDVISGRYYGVWPIDFDMDGDLDLLLAPEKKAAFIVQNNGDDTFEAKILQPKIPKVRQVLWADFELDGDSDLILLSDQGKVHFLENLRGEGYQRDTSFAFSQPVYDINFGDFNKDGTFEVIGWQKHQIEKIQYDDQTLSWKNLSLIPFQLRKEPIGSNAQVLTADLDNNGSQDIILSDSTGTKYWLSNQWLSFDSTAKQLAFITQDIADINGDHRLDLIGFSHEGESLLMSSKGSEDYNGRTLYPRASGAVGDGRINAFGIGGEIEFRSGKQYGKQAIRRPWVHLGLGSYSEAEMVRVIWPNGTSQTEFAELGYESKIMNEQILKGSCPWIYTYDGKEMTFVTDFLWKTALGLKINIQGEAEVLHSIDWIKIKGNQLQPRKGVYDVRITADLWESHFFDQVSLMAVDYSSRTEVFVDERFKLPAPQQKLYQVQNLKPIVSATDFRGKDITTAVAALDENYSTPPPLSQYQGVAGEHYIELDLGEHPKGSGKQLLIASGWVYPTDTSINTAISQGAVERPSPLSIKIPDGAGGWKMARSNIGFPSGKDKTMVIDLDNLFEGRERRQMRLYTSMEIYWDQFQIGTQVTDEEVDTQRLTSSKAELRYRGFSKLVNTGRFEPTKGDYQQISSTAPKWFNLEGFYTRFGDVKELVKERDDRYVIMNAGDELKFEFPALKPPKPGWKRDFVLIGDGWVKDGDFNTGQSKTLRPLPYHGLKDYSQKYELLMEDPVFKQHRKDWINYHTRYIKSQRFNAAINR